METYSSRLNYFSQKELALWGGSVILILGSFLIFDRTNYLMLIASFIGVTSLIFNAKGNPFGQFLMVIFSLLYGIISYSFSYYGEMMTYVGMTGPMALFALISWIKNPFNGNKAEVEVNRLSQKETILMLLLALVVTGIFYFILRAFDTANLIPSTLSVTTSFIAVYLTYRRSAHFALVYAANDIILIILWTLASMTDISYLSVVICFIVFLINDIYCFINWSKMQERQEKEVLYLEAEAA